MKTLKARPHPHPKKARDGYVQIYVNGRWWGTRVPITHCYKWKEGQGYICKASGEDFEFVQLEDDTDCDLVEAAGIKPWNVAYGNIFRRCKLCGHYYHTGYGHRPTRTRGSIPLAMGTLRYVAVP